MYYLKIQSIIKPNNTTYNKIKEYSCIYGSLMDYIIKAVDSKIIRPYYISIGYIHQDDNITDDVIKNYIDELILVHKNENKSILGRIHLECINENSEQDTIFRGFRFKILSESQYAEELL